MWSIKKSAARRRLAGCFGGVLAAALLGAVAVSLAGDPMDPQTRDLVRQAEAAYRSGQFEAAGELYGRARERSPESAALVEHLGAIALLENRAEEAAACFEEALRRLRWPFSMWPLNAALKAHLGMAFYRADRFVEAAPMFREASGPIPVGPFRELRALADHAALLSSGNPYRLSGPDASRIPFVVTDPLPVVPVFVNGGGPWYFIIDTGGAEVILDDGLAQQAGARMAGAFSGTYAGGLRAETGVGRVSSITLGEFTLADVPIHTLDLGGISNLFDGREIRGAIGTRLLMHFLGTLDYREGALILRRPTDENRAALDSSIEASGAVEVPFWLAELHYMLAWGTVNGSGPMLFLVDTGLAGGGFTAPEETLRSLGIEVDWSTAQAGTGGGGAIEAVGFVLDRLTLGSGSRVVAERDVPGAAIRGSTAPLGATLGFPVDGLISHAFFRNHVLTLDFEAMRLVVE